MELNLDHILFSYTLELKRGKCVTRTWTPTHTCVNVYATLLQVGLFPKSTPLGVVAILERWPLKFCGCIIIVIIITNVVYLLHWMFCRYLFCLQLQRDIYTGRSAFCLCYKNPNLWYTLY